MIVKLTRDLKHLVYNMYKTNSQWSVYRTFLPNCSWATGCLTLPILSPRPSLPPFRVSASHLRDEDVWVLFSAWTSCPPPESWFFVPHCLLGPFLSAQLAACSVGVLDSLLPELPVSFSFPSASMKRRFISSFLELCLYTPLIDSSVPSGLVSCKCWWLPS